MRNLKKVLSLTLALVMLLGMMVVGAGAAEYTDKADIQYKEAVEVMSAIGVIDGVGGGKFDPAGNLTRAQAAKLITYMVLGKSVADKLPNTGSKFVDCPENEWYVGSVNYLTDLGIISGVGGGRFDPESQVTGVEFAKMLLGILGYDAKNEKFVDDPNWAANIAVRARQAGLDADMTTQTVNSQALNRDQAAQMGFNTLKSNMKFYDGGTDVTTPDGTVVKVGGRLTDVANEVGPKGHYNNTNDRIMQFCEQYYPGLKLTADGTAVDEFGRTSNEWKLDNKSVCKAATNGADATFTAKVKAADVKNAIGSASGNANIGGASTGVATKVIVNGVTLTGAGNTGADVDQAYIVSLTGNGRLVEVYLDEEDHDKIAKVVVVDTVLGTVTRVNSKKEEITISLDTSIAASGSLTTDVGYGTFEKDDVVLVTAAKDDSAASGKIDSSFDAVTVDAASNVVTGIASRKDNSSITVDGTKYTEAYGVATDKNAAKFTVSAEKEATLYLDANGYILKAETGVKAAVDTAKVIAPTGSYATMEDGKIVYKVEGIGPDGEKLTLTVKNETDATTMTGLNVAMYTVTSGVVDTASIKEATTSNAPATGFTTNLIATTGTTSLTAGAKTATVNSVPYYYADSVKTIYVTSTGHKVSVVDGVKATSGQTVTYVLSKVGTNNVISAVYVQTGDDKLPVTVTDPDNFVYVAAGGSNGTTAVGKKTYYNYNAYLNGEKIEFFAEEKDAVEGFYSISKNDDGAYKLTGTEYASGQVRVEYKSSNPGGTVITIGTSTVLAIDDKTVIVDVTTGEDVPCTVAELNELKADETVWVSALSSNNVAKIVYLVGSGKAQTSKTDAASAFGTADAIKALDTGAYQFTNKPDYYNGTTNGHFGYNDVAANCRVFVFECAAGDDVALEIYNTNGTLAFRQIGAGLTAGKHFFTVQVTGTGIANWGAGNTPNAAIGEKEFESTGLSASTNNWSISTSQGTVLASGTITVS